jgi:hypothetical protein
VVNTQRIGDTIMFETKGTTMTQNGKLSIASLHPSSEPVFDETEGVWTEEPHHQASRDLDLGLDDGMLGYRIPPAANPDEEGYDRMGERTFKCDSPAGHFDKFTCRRMFGD